MTTESQQPATEANTELQVDLSDKNRSPYSLGIKIARVLWACVWNVLFRLSPRPLAAWRRLLLRLFGARIGRGVRVYPSCRIQMPWNLSMADYSVAGGYSELYCLGKVTIGKHAVVSQRAHLCAATHDYEHSKFPVVAEDIHIGDQAWVCADAFVGPKVTVGEGAVLAARAVAVTDVEPWTVVGGNPARFIKKRQLRT